MSPRYLTASAAATFRRLSARGATVQARALEELAPKTLEAARGWTWGRGSHRLEVAGFDPCPSTVLRLFWLVATEYRIVKGKGGRLATYRHEHAEPLASVATCPSSGFAPSKPQRPPRLVGPGLYLLGDLVALEGEDASGNLVRLEEGSHWPKSSVRLCGCPQSGDMHVVRTTAARRQLAPLWIVREGSHYRLTERGIEK